MFEVFLIMRQLHELLWYLSEALTLQPACSIHGVVSSKLYETESLTHLSPDDLTKLDVAEHRAGVNELLLKTSKLVRAEVRQGHRARQHRRGVHAWNARLAASDRPYLSTR